MATAPLTHNPGNSTVQPAPLQTQDPAIKPPAAIAPTFFDWWRSDGDEDDDDGLRSIISISGEYLYWWTKAQQAPGSATTNGDGNSGFRITAAYQLACVVGLGVEISGFALPRQSDSFAASSNATTQLWGVEGNVRGAVLSSSAWRLDWLGGFRYLDLGEGMNNVQTGAAFDNFATHNSFYGVQAGLDAEYKFGNWFVDVRGKLGFGATNQTGSIDGGSLGRSNTDRFSFVPELNGTVGYQITDNIRIFAGYNFLYWTGVARPGNPIQQTSFWGQGVNAGLEFRF
jgi:hypothetical protein